MNCSYYIYYRVDAAKTGPAAVAVEYLLDAVLRKTGVQGRVMKKRNEPLLWMEIYENVSDEAGFEWQLAEAVAGSGINGLLQPGSARHTECFGE
jgi:Domain of unknown function (DUF4936)